MGSKNLNEKIMECISNPAKSRLMIEIMRRGKVTAKYLAEKCVDIPQTTLYRYLKRMTDDGPVSYTHLDVYKRQPWRAAT